MGRRLTEHISWSGILSEKPGVRRERGAETDEKGCSAVESDHWVCVRDLHHLGNFISGDAREPLSCFFMSRSSRDRPVSYHIISYISVSTECV